MVKMSGTGSSTLGGGLELVTESGQAGSDLVHGALVHRPSFVLLGVSGLLLFWRSASGLHEMGWDR